MRPRAHGGPDTRGSAAQRRSRRRRLWEAYAVADVLLCQRPGCEAPITLEDLGDGAQMTVDRIVPGMHGWKYVAGNCRPVCAPCNVELGNAIRDGLRL